MTKTFAVQGCTLSSGRLHVLQMKRFKERAISDIL
jgi:hypothetical protein